MGGDAVALIDDIEAEAQRILTYARQVRTQAENFAERLEGTGIVVSAETSDRAHGWGEVDSRHTFWSFVDGKRVPFDQISIVQTVELGKRSAELLTAIKTALQGVTTP